MSRPSAEAAPLRYEDAARLIQAQVEPITGHEVLPLVEALGRVLAVDLVASSDVPAHDNAAMDGYALSMASAAAGIDPRTTGFRQVGDAFAGRPFEGTVGPGECIRIMTGAVLPADCDTVVPFEDVVVDGERIRATRKVVAGQHRRRAGEDLAAGAVVLARGRRITPSDLGLAASIGRASLDVGRRLRVAVFSTGNELRDVDDPLDAGTIRDSNRYTLIGMLQRLGAEVVDLGIVGDDPEALEVALRRACATADAIVTSGGVSAGDADHTREVLARLGAVAFWKLAIKPGRPMAFGRIASHGRSSWLFALPGNPVAVMVVFYALVREALLALMGARDEAIPAITAACDAALAKSAGRTEFVRAVATRGVDGWHVVPTGAQGSGILRSMSEANCLIVLGHDRGPVAAGDTVEAWPFHGLL